MLTLLNSIWPRSLSRQLALANNTVLIITILGFASFSASLQTHQKFETHQKQIEVFGKNIASLAEKYLNQKQQDQLEAKLYQLIHYPHVNAIYVINEQSQAVLSIRMRENGKVVSETAPQQRNVPPDNKQTFIARKEFTEYWFPFSSADDGERNWVYIEYDPNVLETVTIEIYKKSLSVALLAIFVSLFVLRKLLYKPMRELKKAAEFAEWIDMAQGSQIEVTKSSVEVEQLLRALNRTSEKLYRQEENQRSNTVLLDTIRDIQSQFISEINMPKVFESVVLNCMQLTKSEFGFFGEVMIDENEKPYMKMKAVSSIAINKHTQEFFDKYDVKNFRFNNFNNLFGAVIQARKVVIANEAPNDPRRGGLPSGHPKITSFLGLPVFLHDRVVGVIGLANRIQGYDQGMVAYLQPLLSTCAHMIEGNRNEENRKTVLDELNKSNASLEVILNSIADGILTLTEGGIVKYVNSQAANMFTNQTNSMIGSDITRYIENLKFENGRVLIHGKQIHVHAANEKFHWRMTGKHKDGTRFPLELSLSECKQSGEKIFVGTIHNMEHHAETNMLKEGFLASINDELRETLASIRGSLSILSGNITDKLNTNVLSVVGNAYKNTEHLIQLFENVNDITKIESGEIELSMGYVDSTSFVDHILSANQDVCRKNNLTLVATDITESPMFCDETRMLQVMRNLIHSAAEYCCDGDVIEISVKGQESSLLISIIGISKDNRQEFHIKNRNKFVRLYMASENQTVDNDFDLHLCKAIVDHHDGKMTYETTVNNAAKFTIVLPAVMAHDSASNM